MSIKKTGGIVFVNIVLSALFCLNAWAETVITDNIFTDTVWDNAGSPYVVTNQIYVGNNATLNIEPGVVVKFNDEAGLNVGAAWSPGRLMAVGTETDSIVFTSSSGSDSGWVGIYLDEWSDDIGTSVLSYCVIEKAGQEPSCSEVTARAVKLEISNSRLSGNNNIARFFNSGFSDSVVFLHNKLTGSGDYYWVYESWGYIRIDSCEFSGNMVRGLRLGDIMNGMNGNAFPAGQKSPIEISGYVERSITILKQSNSFYKYTRDGGYDNLVVRNSSTLTVAPGVEIVFDTLSGVLIGDSWSLGRLLAVGTELDSIYFTSSTGTDSGWGGIMLSEWSDDLGPSQLAYCVVEKAGRPDYFSEIQCWNTGAEISHCRITGNNDVIKVFGSDTVKLHNCTIGGEGNFYWIYVNGWNGVKIDSCTFVGKINKGVMLGYIENLRVFQDNIFPNDWESIIEFNASPIESDFTIRKFPHTYYKIHPGGGWVDIQVKNASTLTIDPGVKMKFDTTGLSVGNSGNAGRLIALGSESDSIFLTSVSGADSGWPGIILGEWSDDIGISQLYSCVIEKAINGLTCINTQTLVSGSVIQQNGNYGVWLNNADMEIVKSKIINNRSCGIYNESYYGLLKIGGSPANSCQLYGNGTYECYNAGAESVMAYSNYWGTTDLALIDSRIYDYYDDNNWGIVHYTAIPLAVQLTSFTAVSAENGVVISWRTESESDCYQWSVERRPAGGIYQQIYSTGGQTNSATPRQYDHTDNSPLTGGDYEYLLTQTSSTGQTIHYGPVSISIAGKNPTSFALNGCYPNPASYRAAIDYQLPEQAQVTIKIYNALGQLVRTLVDETQPAGYYQRSWDGTGQQSNTVSSGTYIYRMEAGGGKYSKIKKMIWLK